MKRLAVNDVNGVIPNTNIMGSDEGIYKFLVETSSDQFGSAQFISSHTIIGAGVEI